MGVLRGERTVEIQAPLVRCYAIAADIDRAASWQAALQDVDVLQRDGEGRASSVDAEFDARVRTIRARLRFSYREHERIDWKQDHGDVKALIGWWRFEELGDKLIRATYGLEVDPGMMLGMLLRGGMEDRVREFLLGGAAEGLKERAEGTG
ncbi:MAG TPA: SRPBCC family protein [Solirubrobacteraceae bacterium]|jgi:ribosome-associated toxin RatA of RatAB toxin-antitoxin module